jgi:hypothetical protein
VSKNNDITALSKEDLIQEVMQLKHQVSLLQKMVFGPKSDRFKLPADIAANQMTRILVKRFNTILTNHGVKVGTISLVKRLTLIL